MDKIAERTHFVCRFKAQSSVFSTLHTQKEYEQIGRNNNNYYYKVNYTYKEDIQLCTYIHICIYVYICWPA